jgi:ABC-type multidrug transport system fused ATPase/permease subunit
MLKTPLTLFFIVLEKGKIVEMGKHSDLIKIDNYYARYYKLQEISSQAQQPS